MNFAIIVTFNASKWIDKCFKSLINSTVPVTVIAIDNASTDGTPDIIRTKFPGVELIENSQNIGFGRANNIGLRIAYNAGCDHIFLLNQDAWVEYDTIENLINVSKLHPEFGIISPIHLNGEGKELDYGFGNYIYRDVNHSFLSDLFLKGKNDLREIYQIDFINAAFWLMPRKTIETVGGFNPFFFQYGEDREYVNRCHYFNLKIGFVPSAKSYHDRNQVDSPEKSKILDRTLLLVRFFNPADKYSVNKYIKGLTRIIIKKLIFLKFNSAKPNILELKHFLKHQKVIKDYTKKVLTKGLTFIE